MRGIEACTAAIAALLNEFCWRVDACRGSEVAELFVEAGTIDTPRFNLVGRDAIHSWFSARADPRSRLSRHIWTNLRVRPDGDDVYIAEAYSLTIVGTPPAPAHGAKIVVGTSTDRIVFENGQARFASRSLELAVEGRLVPEELLP